MATLRTELAATPFGAILERSQEVQEDPKIAIVPPKGIGIGNLLDWASRTEFGEGGFVEQRTFETDGFMNTFGPWFVGSLFRDPNEAAGQAKYWRDLRDTDYPAFVQHQVDVALERTDAQEQWSGMKAGDDVRNGIRLLGQIDIAEDARRDELGIDGNELPQRDRFEVLVEVLSRNGLLNRADAQRYLAEADKLPVSEILDLRLKILLDEGKLQATSDWMRNLRDLQWYTTSNFPAAIATVKDEGLGNFAAAANADWSDRVAYGRRIAAYMEDRAVIKERYEADPRARTAALNQLELEWDHTIKINGVEYPSATAMEWGRMDAPHRRANALQAAHTDWEDVSPFLRRQLGRPSPRTVIAGWAELNKIRDQFYEENRYGMRQEAVLRVAKLLDTDPKYRGIYKDAIYALQPGYRRFQLTTVYQRSQHRTQWDELIGLAQEFNRLRYSGDYTKGRIDDGWATLLNEQILPWVQRDADFWEEVDAMGTTWLKDMIK